MNILTHEYINTGLGKVVRVKVAYTVSFPYLQYQYCPRGRQELIKIEINVIIGINRTELKTHQTALGTLALCSESRVFLLE